jgi:hypothetical protein
MTEKKEQPKPVKVEFRAIRGAYAGKAGHFIKPGIYEITEDKALYLTVTFPDDFSLVSEAPPESEEEN